MKKYNLLELLRASYTDLLTMEEIVNVDYLSHMVGFHAHQSIEKTLLALLIEHTGNKMSRKHDLIHLKGLASKYIKIKDERILEELNQLHRYYRYPSSFRIYSNIRPTLEDAAGYYFLSNDIFNKVCKVLNVTVKTSIGMSEVLMNSEAFRKKQVNKARSEKILRDEEKTKERAKKEWSIILASLDSDARIDILKERIKSIHSFISRYPESEYIKDAKYQIDILSMKIERREIYLSQLSPVEKKLEEMYEKSSELSKATLLFNAIKDGMFDSNKCEALLLLKRIMEESNRWKERSEAKNTEKDWHYQRTQNIKLMLEECKEDIAGKVFLSCGDDRYNVFIEKVQKFLEKEKFKTFIDYDGFRKNDHWEFQLANKIEECDSFIFFITEESAKKKSGYALKELSYALSLKKKIFPILVESQKLPLPIEQIQYLDMRSYISKDEGEEFFTKAMNNLVQQLKNAVKKEENGETETG